MGRSVVIYGTVFHSELTSFPPSHNYLLRPNDFDQITPIAAKVLAFLYPIVPLVARTSYWPSRQDGIFGNVHCTASFPSVQLDASLAMTAWWIITLFINRASHLL